MAHRRRGVGVSRTTTRNTVPRSGQPRRGVGVNRRVDDRDRDRDDDDNDNGDNSTSTGDQNQNTLLQKKADEMHAFSMQSAVDTIERLQIKLTDFAKTHQSDIQDDPAFRQQFLQMCAPLGIDPLVSQKGFWAKTLGVGIGDFYYELSVKVAEVCFATRTENGGIMAVSEVCDTLNTTNNNSNTYNNYGTKKQKNKQQLYSQGDITIAVKKLSTLGGGFRIIQVGKTTTSVVDMIVSVPTELDNDHMEIMTIAAAAQGGGGNRGCVTVEDVQQQLRWETDRVERAISLLLEEGMAWKDEYHGISFYWFPSVWKETRM